MMRKTMGALAAAGALLAGALLAGLGAASPALAQSPSITLLCSVGSNGGTLINGLCVLPAATVGQPYEAFLLTSNGAAGTIVGGTPTKPGTYTFTVHVTPFGATTPSTNGTYSITVGPPPPLT